MIQELTISAYQRLWLRVQQIGLNAYEARTYVALVGHPRRKALELAARAGVPRQKIYEVLDSLADKGFVQAVQEKTKIFYAVEPSVAIPNYLARRHAQFEQEWTEHSRMAAGLVDDLKSACAENGEGQNGLELLRIAADPGQAADQYRQMILSAESEYLDFYRPPIVVDLFQEELVQAASRRGVDCRLILDPDSLMDGDWQRVEACLRAGASIRNLAALPMKLAVFDAHRGLLSLPHPQPGRSAWTSVVFQHPGMAEAMKGLFESYWQRAGEL